MKVDIEITLGEIFAMLREGRAREGAELLYNNYYNKIYAIAFSVLKDEGDTSDVVHNVVSKIIDLPCEMLPRSGEARWFYTVTRNEALMYLRKKPKTLSMDEIAPHLEYNEEDKSIRDFVDMDAYYGMIRGLGKTRQQVVTLKVLGGYTHREIAAMLGKPVGTVQWLYNTAIKSLRATLSSMLTLVVLTAVALGRMFAHYYDKFIDPDYGSSGGKVELLEKLNNRDFCTALLIVLILVFVLIISIFINFFTKSDKIPTKAGGKNIYNIQRPEKRGLKALISVYFYSLILAIAVTTTYIVTYETPELPPLTRSLDFAVTTDTGKDRSVTETDYPYDYFLKVGIEYYFDIFVVPSYGSSDVHYHQWDDKLVYDESLMKIVPEKVGGLVLWRLKIIPLKPFENASVIIEINEPECSGAITVTAFE